MNVSFSRAPNFCGPFIQWLEHHHLAETPFSEWTYSSALSFFLCRGLFVPLCSTWHASKYVLEVLLRGAFGNRLHRQAYVLKTSQTTWPDRRTTIKPRLCSPIVARGGRAQRSPRKEIWDNYDDHHSRDNFWLRCTLAWNRELRALARAHEGN